MDADLVKTLVGQCGDQSKSEMECVMLVGCATRAMQKRVLERTGKCFLYNDCTHTKNSDC